MAQTDEDVFSEVRLVRDFLWLLWDMAVRPQIWDWEIAHVSFKFYAQAAAYKFGRIFRLEDARRRPLHFGAQARTSLQ